MTENDAHPDAPAGQAPPPGPPPWISEEIQQRIAWRDGDVVVSVPPKSGTTWTMNIVHQLRAAGDPDLTDLYLEVPWLEFVPSPTSTIDELVAAFDAMPDHRRRAFKTHAPPGMLPYQEPGAGPDVRYVVVVRNPDEALASFRPFIAAHADAWFDLWQVPRDALVGADFESYFDGMGSQALAPMVFGFVAGWWPLRHAPNVLFLHFADLKRDHDGSIRRIAEFLGFEVPEARWPAVLEYTSFAWMKANEDRFELRQAAGVPVLDPGAMIRKGKVGAAAEDGVTPRISAAMASIGRGILQDEQILTWCYQGGPLPD